MWNTDTNAHSKYVLANWVKIAWKFLTSMRFGLFLIGTITLVAVMGSFIPQRENPSFYVEMYGRALGPLFIASGLADVFHSRWFILLTLLLGLNLSGCALIRCHACLRRIFHLETKDSVNQLKNCQRYRELNVTGVDIQVVNRELHNMLRANGYRVKKNYAGDNWQVTARRGVFGYLGSPMLHIALLLVIAGAMLGGVYGKSINYQTAVPGILQLTRDGFPFDLKVEDFKIDYYSNGRPSQYRSKLAVVDDGQIKMEKTIAVNDPLSHRGVKVYQSNYDWMLTGTINDGKNKRSFEVENGGMLQLAGPGGLALGVDFLPDYQRDAEGRPYSRSQQPNNPKVFYVLYSNGMPFGMGEADVGRELALGEVSVKFDGYKYFTGLTVKKDPGVPVVWTGFGLLLIGMGLHFYVRPRCVWALLSPGINSVTVHLATEGIFGPGVDQAYDLERQIEVKLANFGVVKECPA